MFSQWQFCAEFFPLDDFTDEQIKMTEKSLCESQATGWQVCAFSLHHPVISDCLRGHVYRGRGNNIQLTYREVNWNRVQFFST